MTNSGEMLLSLYFSTQFISPDNHLGSRVKSKQHDGCFVYTIIINVKFSKFNVDSNTINKIDEHDERWTEATGKKDGDL